MHDEMEVSLCGFKINSTFEFWNVGHECCLMPSKRELFLPCSVIYKAVSDRNYFNVLIMQRVDNKLRMLERRNFGKDSSPIRVAVVGCGYSGVELAATISERLQDKGIVQAINVDTIICPTAPSGNREVALKVSILDGKFLKIPVI